MASNPQDNTHKNLFNNSQNPNPNQQSTTPRSGFGISFNNNANSSGFTLFGNNKSIANPANLLSSSSGGEGVTAKTTNMFGQSAANSMFPTSKLPEASQQTKTVPMFQNSGFFNINPPKLEGISNSSAKSEKSHGSSQQGRKIFGGVQGNKGAGLFGNNSVGSFFGVKKEDQKKNTSVEDNKKQSVPQITLFSKKQPNQPKKNFFPSLNMFGQSRNDQEGKGVEGEKKEQTPNSFVKNAAANFLETIKADSKPDKFKFPAQKLTSNSQQNPNQTSQNRLLSNNKNTSISPPQTNNINTLPTNPQVLTSTFGPTKFTPFLNKDPVTSNFFAKKQQQPLQKKSQQTPSAGQGFFSNLASGVSKQQQLGSFGERANKLIKNSERKTQQVEKQQTIIKQSSNQIKTVQAKAQKPSNLNFTTPSFQTIPLQTNDEHTNKNSFSFTTKVQNDSELPSVNISDTSSAQTSKPTVDKLTRESKSIEAGARKPFSFLKPRQNAAGPLIDFRTIKQQQKRQNFNAFLSESIKNIITSFKLYFTSRTAPFKPKQINENNERNRFIGDLTNVMAKSLGLGQESWDLLNNFIKIVIVEQKYQIALFKDDYLNADYILNNMFYLTDFSNKFYLNETTSKQLQLLCEKIVNKWHLQKNGIIAFLYKYPDLLHRPSDLFMYLFKHLLESENRLIQTANFALRVFISDFEAVTRKRLAELLNYYNKKLKDFIVLTSLNQLKALINLAEQIKDEEVEEVSLKILLKPTLQSQSDSYKFNYSTEFLQFIKKTKSFVLMPLRALAHKLGQKKREFLPQPKDLYKYIKGDQWIDWLDLYLYESKRQSIELQAGQPEQIVQSLSTIQGQLLSERLLHSRKGISKFFNFLRDENMVVLYYKLLQACIHSDRSIIQIEEFYFKKMNFNLQYQQIVDFVINFNERAKAGEGAMLSIVEVKIALLIKILEISPTKLIELERYLFYRDYNKNKKFKPNNTEARPQGEKIIHLFLDTISIISLTNHSTKILHRIFRLLTHLLKNKQTERPVLNALKLNRPSFEFTKNGVNPQIVKQMNSLLQHALSKTYLQDLIFSYSQCKDQQIRLQAFYPLRYQDEEFNNLGLVLKIQGNELQNSFSIYWLNQLVKILTRQRFNPVLVYKILEKLYINPYNTSNQLLMGRNSHVLYRKNKVLDSKIPTIFENIISVLNELAVWEDIQKILQFVSFKKNGKTCLVNKYVSSQSQLSQKYTFLFYTLKLVRLIFRLSNLLSKYEEDCSQHFVIRALSAIHFLSKSKINSLFSTNAGKNSILISIIATFQYQQECGKQIVGQVTWEAEAKEQGEANVQELLKYISKNGKDLDIEQANNLLKRPQNDFYEPENSIISISLDILIEILKFSPESSIEHNLTMLLPLRQDQKSELSKELLNKFIDMIIQYVQNPRVGCKIMEFIYNLKYNCGVNKLHSRLSTKLFDQFTKINKNTSKSPKFSSIVCKYLLKQLERQNSSYELFTELFIQGMITNFKFKDSYLNNYYEFKDTKEIGKMMKNYHAKHYGLLNLDQVERIIDERAIIQIAYQFQYINTVADILVTQILRKKQSQNLINCVQLFNTLILNNNMIMLEKDLPNEYRMSKVEQKFDCNANQPRLYIRDPVEVYITETRNVKKKSLIQVHQKNNVIEWALDKSQIVSDRITRYIKFILTVDKYPYSNNPISFTIQKNDPATLQLFTHISLGKMNCTAIELFGKSSSDAIDSVQGIASNLINRLVEARKLNGQSTSFELAYKQGLRVLGYCLQWLRGKERYGQNSSHSLIRRLQKNYFFLLPQGNQNLTSESIKILLSVLSMGQKYFSNQAKGHIREAIYSLINKYWGAIQKGLILEEVRTLGELVQQAISVLILIPPQKNESHIFELLINIWVKQKNFQFFFNQSRLILELTTLYPQQIVRLQPLTRCQIVSNLTNFYSRYQDKQRRFDTIAWTWIVKIASELVNHSLSVLVISQVSSFFKYYKDRFICLFEVNDSINRSYVEDLQVLLQLLVCLFSHDLWVNFNRQLAEQMTYLLSHNLIKVFIAYAQGRLSFSVSSHNDKSLCQIKCSATVEEQFIQNIDYMTQDNAFIAYMRIKFVHCLRNYCILMKKAFKSSHFVQVYFENSVINNKKYFSSFWDIFNKHMVTLCLFSCKQFKIWSSVKKLNDTLNTLQQCNNAPNTFVENGYISTIIEIPRNQYQLFSDIYLLNYLVSELAVVHYLKQKLYVSRYNNLLASHIDSFSRKIKQHVDNVKIEFNKINGACNQYISQKEFDNISEVIDINKTRKI